MHIMDVYTTDDIAEMLKMSPGMIRSLIRDKKLPAVKIGSEYRILKEDFEKFILDNKTM
jgi:excisionase family DNA binding protein